MQTLAHQHRMHTGMLIEEELPLDSPTIPSFLNLYTIADRCVYRALILPHTTRVETSAYEPRHSQARY
jgi:hypothetical protein